MQLQRADSTRDSPLLATPQFQPPPPNGATTGEVAFEVGVDRVYRIHDPEGRRLFEGWGSLVGIDWQDEEITPEAFARSAQDYLDKNPVLLWDHKRHIPIGKCLAITITAEGIYIKGELLRGEASSTLRPPTNPQTGQVIDGFESFTEKANEVWQGIKQGMIRGLSVNGKARRRAVWSSELGRYVAQVIEVLLHEISITPTQVHPGARITAIADLAKALECTKALTFQPLHKQTERKKNTMTAKEIMEMQAGLIEALREAGSIDLPQEFMDTQDAISKALQPVEEPATSDNDEVTKSLMDELNTLKAEVAALKGTPAAPIGQITHESNPATSPKPGDTTGGKDAIAKSLDILASSKDGIADYGKGQVHRCNAESAMKLCLMQAATKGKIELGKLDFNKNEIALVTTQAGM